MARNGAPPARRTCREPLDPACADMVNHRPDNQAAAGGIDSPPHLAQGERRPCGSVCVPVLHPGTGFFTLYVEGDDLIAAMLKAIAGARYRICLETYIFAADEVGRLFIDALGERATAGVDVRLSVDAFGSFGHFPRRAERELRARGVRTRRFHRWRWKDPWRYNRRNHRKLLVVDGREAFVGGFNVHRQASRRVFGATRWRDTHVRVMGELACRAEALFDGFWRTGTDEAKDEAAGASSILLSNHTRRCRYRLRCALMDMFSEARETIWLTTPYFVPDHLIRRGLRQAARRGIDVRLLVPRVTDVRPTRWAAQAVYGELLAAGVRIFEYLPRMIHAKTAVADGEFALLGTANLDYRSLLVNYELVLASRDRGLCTELHAQFLRDLAAAEEIHLAGWRGRGWPLRLAQVLSWGIRRWL